MSGIFKSFNQRCAVFFFLRKLAEDSATQGKTITATLKALGGEIETLSASSKTVEEKFNAIFTLAEQVKEMSAHLTESMREQEHGSREVLTAIKSINTVTTEVQAGSEEMLKGGEGVASEMQKLDGLTRVITESMNEMASGAVQINNAVHGILWTALGIAAVAFLPLIYCKCSFRREEKHCGNGCNHGKKLQAESPTVYTANKNNHTV